MTTSSPTCFSPISTIRCQGFSKLQYIVLFIPIGVQLLVLAVLLIVIWRIPKLTLFLLAIEILLNVSIISWDLVIKLINPIDLMTFKVEDTILAIISPIPNLFLHLTLTSYILDSPLRSSFSDLSASSDSRARSIILLFAGCVVASLIPISLISSILPSFIPLEYWRMKDGIIKISFVMLSDTGTFKLLVDIGVFTGIAYTVTIGVLVFSSASTGSDTARSTASKKEKISRYLVVVGMILASIEIGLSISKNQRFISILIRRVLHLVSRVCLVFGFIHFYRSKYLSQTTSEGIITSHEVRSEGKTEKSRDGRKGKGRDTITTFGTPPSAFLSTFDHPLPQSQPQRIPSKATRRKPSTRKPGEKLQIGDPILGSFKKNHYHYQYQYDPTSGLGGNKDFYDLGLGVGVGGKDMKFGIGMIGSQLAGTGLGSPRIAGSRPDNGRKDSEKVRLKIQNNARAPILSFTPSTFTQSSLDALASSIPRFPIPHPHPHPHQNGYNVMDEYKLSLSSPHNSSATAKKNVGSIYSPDRISVDQSDLSIWPPVIMIDRSNGHYSYRPKLDSTITDTDRRNGSGNVIPINDYSYSSSNPKPNFTKQNYPYAQRRDLSGEEGVDGTKRRTRSGTDTERGIWFTPSSLNQNDSTSSITYLNHDILGYGSSSLRPTLGYRKSTDPTEAIYPSPTASSTLEGSSTPLDEMSGIVKKQRIEEDGNQKRDDKKNVGYQQQRQSLNSSYSQTIHSTQSISNSTIKNLFYSTPIQSPSSPLSDADSSSNSNSNSSLSRSYRTLIPSKNTRLDENPFDVSSSLYSDKNEVGTRREMKKNTNTRDDVDHNHILRKSELQTVLKSLNQLRRETGFSGTFDLDVESNVDNRDSSVYSQEDTKRPWTTKEIRTSHDGSSESGITIDSDMISNDDLTPVAEITLINGGRRNFGGVI